MTVYELCERDVVNVTTGQNLGKVDDISFEPETASITGRHRKNRDGCSFGAHGGIRAAQKQKKIVWSEIKWVDKVFYNNEVENVKFLKSGSLAFENREDV